jgi:predicted RNase H-like nuclease (RuvC/YqgF family)
LKLQEQLKAETHVSEAAFRSLKLAEDEFKSKLQQLEGVINNLKKQLEAKDGILQNNNEKQKQLQATIDVQTKTEEANNRTVQELREKEKQLQATIVGQTKTEEANTRTVQELREKEKQLQATIDCLTKTEESLNQTAQLLLCGQPKDVSTCKVEAVSTNEWTEIPPAGNIVNFRPSTVVW